MGFIFHRGENNLEIQRNSTECLSYYFTPCSEESVSVTETLHFRDVAFIVIISQKELLIYIMYTLVCYVIHHMDYASIGADKDDECAICLDTLKNARTLKCKHVFCTSCVERTLKYDNRCPVCKEKFRGINPKEKCRFRDFIKVYQAIKVMKLKE